MENAVPDAARRHGQRPPHPGNWWVIPLFVVVVVGSGGANFSRGHIHAAVAAGLGALATVLLLQSQRRPLEVLVLNEVLVAIYLATGQGNGPILLTPVVAMFLAARGRDPRAAWPWPALAVGIGLLGLGLRALWPQWSAGQAFWQGLVTIAVLAAALAFGAMSRSRGEAQQERVQRAATEEQLRMAQDLHDGVGHGLAVIAMQAGVALHVLDKEPERTRESLLAIRDTSRESLEALRAELSRLTPGQGEPASRRPRNGITDLPALVARIRAGGLAVRLSERHGDIPDPIGAVAYLVVQESLTNALRHSGASAVEVSVYDDTGDLQVIVMDDGRGGPVHEGMGIRGMRARVEALGGSVTAGPAQVGFTVQAWIPLAKR